MNVPVFISHSIQDNEVVLELQKALVAQGLDAHTDARVIRDGDPLSSGTRQAIEQAQAFVLTISPSAYESEWVQHETRYALQIRNQRDDFRFVPLLLNGAEMGALKWLFPGDTNPIHVDPNPEGIQKVLPDILASIKPR